MSNFHNQKVFRRDLGDFDPWGDDGRPGPAPLDATGLAARIAAIAADDDGDVWVAPPNPALDAAVAACASAAGVDAATARHVYLMNTGPAGQAKILAVVASLLAWKAQQG